MNKVWFRCDRRNEQIFVLNSLKEVKTVPVIGDTIKTSNDDFQKATFRIKPFFKEKERLYRGIKNEVFLDFIVIERTYSISSDSWELICEPTVKSLLFALKNVKTK